MPKSQASRVYHRGRLTTLSVQRIQIDGSSDYFTAVLLLWLPLFLFDQTFLIFYGQECFNGAVSGEIVPIIINYHVMIKVIVECFP